MKGYLISLAVASALLLSAAYLLPIVPAYPAPQVNTGVAVENGDGEADKDAGYVIKAVITDKDGATLDEILFGRGGQPIIFDDKEECESFMQLPFFPEIRAGLDAFVVKKFSADAKTDVSCVPAAE